MSVWEYTSNNGFSGKVRHKDGTDVYSLSIFNRQGDECLHCYRSNATSPTKLKEFVEDFPKFMRMINRADVLDEDTEDDGI